MNPIDFLKTIYFGDRYCSKLVIDSYNNEVHIQVNMISRIRDKSGEWNYYSEEDIENGIIVITGVKKVFFDESGLIPNDQIYDMYAKTIDKNTYEFVLETSHVNETALTNDLVIKIIGNSVHLIDPTKPELKIIS